MKLYKRVSLDDDLDDQLRAELLSQLAHGASQTLNTLKLVMSSGDCQTKIAQYFLHFTIDIYLCFCTYNKFSQKTLGILSNKNV